MKTIIISLLILNTGLFSQSYKFKHFKEYTKTLSDSLTEKNYHKQYSYSHLPSGYGSIEKAVNAEARVRQVPINLSESAQHFGRAFDRKKTYVYQSNQGKEKVSFSYYHYNKEDFKAFDFFSVLGMNKYKDISNFENLGIGEIVGGFPIGIKTTKKITTAKINNKVDETTLYRCEGYFKADHIKDDAQTMAYFSCYSGKKDTPTCFFLSLNYCKDNLIDSSNVNDIKKLISTVAHLNFSSALFTNGEFINPRISKDELQECRKLFSMSKETDDHFPIDKYIHEGKVIVDSKSMKGHGEHLARLCNDINQAYSNGGPSSDILAITD
ncbi:hypothetical protein N9N67_00330 [Bacteriovoracaceae bacterium]|nr:hypothetical protein [Bacteriovoracaceae bacterium]